MKIDDYLKINFPETDYVPGRCGYLYISENNSVIANARKTDGTWDLIDVKNKTILIENYTEIYFMNGIIFIVKDKNNNRYFLNAETQEISSLGQLNKKSLEMLRMLLQYEDTAHDLISGLLSINKEELQPDETLNNFLYYLKLAYRDILRFYEDSVGKEIPRFNPRNGCYKNYKVTSVEENEEQIKLITRQIKAKIKEFGLGPLNGEYYLSSKI